VISRFKDISWIDDSRIFKEGRHFDMEFSSDGTVTPPFEIEHRG
jgi:hypothetical protein